jgi:cold shock CspA family protein
MAQGIIKNIDFARGYGFITPDGGDSDLFFYRMDSLATFDQLSVGARVKFDERPDRRHHGKFSATNVAPQ